jgi:predicted NBD/HSP70 family sugar kinase
MHSKTIFHIPNSAEAAPDLRTKMLRLINAAQPISRSDIATRLRIPSTELTKEIKPLIKEGVLHEDSTNISFAQTDAYFIGVNLGVRTSQVGYITLTGEASEIDNFATPSDPKQAVALVNARIDQIVKKNGTGLLKSIGVSIPGVTNADRTKLVYAPNLSWRDLEIADLLSAAPGVPVIVENDATAAAMFESQRQLRKGVEPSDFILVRSGTGIGVGLFINGQAYRGSGAGRGIAGEFGHMTIVAGGKPCVCGNRGCWEKYASAAAGSSLYLGDRPPSRGETAPRFVEIVSKAENGDNRARRTLEKIGDYLGIGIANVIMGTGIPKIIISGRLVHGWKFIKQPMDDAIKRSIVGRIEGWSVEAGSPVGSALGGALEVAVDHHLKSL